MDHPIHKEHRHGKEVHKNKDNEAPRIRTKGKSYKTVTESELSPCNAPRKDENAEGAYPGRALPRALLTQA